MHNSISSGYAYRKPLCEILEGELDNTNIGLEKIMKKEQYTGKLYNQFLHC